MNGSYHKILNLIIITGGKLSRCLNDDGMESTDIHGFRSSFGPTSSLSVHCFGHIWKVLMAKMIVSVLFWEQEYLHRP